MMGVQSRSYRIGGQAITALLADGAGAAGLIVALHGGGYDARYWHASDETDTSLLTLGAQLGFDVLAVDRPGYKGSAGPASGFAMAKQADLVFDLIDQAAPAGTPVYLIGHSLGGILALWMAAHPRAVRLAAVDVSGVPLRYPPEMQPIIDRAAAGGHGDAVPDLGPDAKRWMFYGEDGTFDPALHALVPGDNPVPMAEMANAFAAPVELPPLMAAIRVPVQWTIADKERSSVGGQAMLDHIRSLMPLCPRLLTTMQLASGHNISLHHVARAYHLRALAFFDESRAGPGSRGACV